MKTLVLAQLGAVAVWVSSVTGQTLISQFSFELATPPDSSGSSTGPFRADLGPGSVSGFHASAGTSYSTPIGNGSANAFSSNSWAIGDYYQFTISTVGFNNLFVTFAMERSATGPITFQFSYSIDGGSNFTAVGSPTDVSSAAFSAATYNPSFVSTFDLSGITGLNNNVNAVFRLVATVGGTTTVGTARVDDFIVSSGGAIFVPEPATLTGTLAGCIAAAGVMLGRRRRRADPMNSPCAAARAGAMMCHAEAAARPPRH